MASLRICLGRATLRPCLDQTRQTLWTIQGTQGLHTSHAVYSNTAGQDAQESTDRTDRTAKQTSDLDLAALLDSSPEFKVDQSAEYYAERLLSPFSANSVGRTGVRDSLMPPQPSTSSSSQVVTPREIWLERQALQRMTPGSVRNIILFPFPLTLSNGLLRRSFRSSPCSSQGIRPFRK